MYREGKSKACKEMDFTNSPQGATMMQIWGTKASVFRDGKWSPFMPYNEAVKLQAEHTAQQIEAALARGKMVIMTCDQTQQLDAVRARRCAANTVTGKERNSQH
jgi:hypothetical protein